MISIHKTIYLSVVLFTIFGCGKDEFESNLSFKIDGEPHICSYFSYSTPNDWAIFSTLSIYCEFGVNPDTLSPNFISIDIVNFDETKSEYPIGVDLTSTFMYLNQNGGISYNVFPGNGNISIEEISDTHIKGSFECVLTPAGANSGYPLVTITEGRFNLKRE